MHRQLERQEDALEKDWKEGRITNAEYNKEMLEHQRDYRAAAQGASWDAYDREFENW